MVRNRDCPFPLRVLPIPQPLPAAQADGLRGMSARKRRQRLGFRRLPDLLASMPRVDQNSRKLHRESDPFTTPSRVPRAADV